MAAKPKRPAKKRAKKASTKKPRKAKGISEDLRERLFDVAEGFEQDHDENRAIVVNDLLRWKLVKASREDLMYAVRALVHRDALEQMVMTPTWVEALAVEIKQRFDFRAERQPLDDESLRGAVEVLSEAVDAYASRGAAK